MNKLEKYRKLLEGDALLLGKVCSPNSCVVKTPDFHHEIKDMWHSNNRRVNILAPRGHAKSTLIKFFSLHHLFFHPSKLKVIVIVSKNQPHAKKILDDLKNMLEYSEGLQTMFGYWGRESAEKWADDEIVLKDGSLITTKGADMQIVGLNWRSQRPTFVIYDDPQDTKNTMNTEQMEKVLKTLLKDIEPGVDPLHGKIWVIGTPQREGCLVLKLKEMPNWKTLHYDAIVDEEKKKVLWKEWINWDDLMDKQASYASINKLSIFFSEYRCQIIGDEEQLFPPRDFMYWDGEYKVENGYGFIKVNAIGEMVKDGLDWERKYTPYSDKDRWRPVTVFMGIDPASSVSNTADYSAIMVLAVDANRNTYMLDLFRKRVKPMDLARTIIGYFKKYRPCKTNIETVGYQEMLRDYLRTECDEYIPGLEVKNNPRNAKSARIETLQPYFYQRNIHFKKDMPNLEEMEMELQVYPRSAHDDILDALYYAKKGNYPPSHTEEFVNSIVQRGGYKRTFSNSYMTA